MTDRFGIIERERVLGEDGLFIVVSDKFPVSPGHTLIILKRAAARIQDLTADEISGLLPWVRDINHVPYNPLQNRLGF